MFPCFDFLLTSLTCRIHLKNAHFAQLTHYLGFPLGFDPPYTNSQQMVGSMKKCFHSTSSYFSKRLFGFWIKSRSSLSPIEAPSELWAFAKNYRENLTYLRTICWTLELHFHLQSIFQMTFSLRALKISCQRGHQCLPHQCAQGSQFCGSN